LDKYTIIQDKVTVPYFNVEVFGEALQLEVANTEAITDINGDFRLEILKKTNKLLNNNLVKIKN